MREILIKGKRIDNGEWEQGYYYQLWERGYILWGMTNDVPDMVEVDHTTVCQYIGKPDKNSKKIWEHDIVSISMEDGLFEVQWDDDTARFIMAGNGLIVDFDNYSSKDIEVVGNTIDNPELLNPSDTDPD